MVTWLALFEKSTPPSSSVTSHRFPDDADLAPHWPDLRDVGSTAISGAHRGSSNSRRPAGALRAGISQPQLIVSPFSKSNFVYGTLTTAASLVRFIEKSGSTESASALARLTQPLAL
jgi:hypothetical protein